MVAQVKSNIDAKEELSTKTLERQKELALKTEVLDKEHKSKKEEEDERLKKESEKNAKVKAKADAENAEAKTKADTEQKNKDTEAQIEKTHKAAIKAKRDAQARADEKVLKTQAEKHHKESVAAEARKAAEKKEVSSREEANTFGTPTPAEKAGPTCTGLKTAKASLTQYLSGENPEAGAVYYVGAKAAVLYVQVKTGVSSHTSENQDNDWGAKAVVHEYINLIQQGLLTRQITSLKGPTPLKDKTKDRFVIQKFGSLGSYNIPDANTRRIQDLLEALPDDFKILTVPTIIVAIPNPYNSKTKGIGQPQVVKQAVDDLAELMFDVQKGCPGIDLEMHVQANANDAVAEGQAEYFAIQALGKAATQQRPKRLFPQGLSSTDLWNADVQKLISERVKEASQLDIQDGNKDLDKGWTSRLEGNQIMEYIMVGQREKGFPALKPGMSFSDFNQIWLDAGNLGFAGAWQKAFGLKWSAFVCKLQNGITGSNKCTASSSWDHEWTSPCTEGQRYKETYPYSLCKPAGSNTSSNLISAESVFKDEDEINDEQEMEDEDNGYMDSY